MVFKTLFINNEYEDLWERENKWGKPWNLPCLLAWKPWKETWKQEGATYGNHGNRKEKHKEILVDLLSWGDRTESPVKPSQLEFLG